MKEEGRKNSVVMFLTVVVGMALALSMVNVLPLSDAQVPPMIELKCGDFVAGSGSVLLDDGLTPVPVGCIIEVRNTNNMNEVLTWFRMGDGTEGPLGVFRAGEFHVWLSLPTGTQITLRAYNAADTGSATLWGDSNNTIIALSGEYPIDGWALGNTQVPNTYDIQYANGNITLITNGLPMINRYDLRDPADDTHSLLNRQLDVGREYYFLVNATDLSGTSNISMVTLRAWHDGGNEATPYGTGVPNTEFALQYNWYNGTYTLMSTYTVADPEITIGAIFVQEYADYNPTPDTFEMRFYFTLGEQIRHAPGDGLFNHPPTGEYNGTDTTAYNDINSWNFDITVLNNNGFSAKRYDEFGIYQYTAISAGDITGEGLPGQIVAFPELPITYSSNDDYNLGVYVNHTLDKIWPNSTPASTIPVDRISVAGGWLVKTPFTGTGYANVEYFFPAHAAPDYGTYQTLPVQFWVDIPLNVLGGVYRGDVVYLIEQI